MLKFNPDITTRVNRDWLVFPVLLFGLLVRLSGLTKNAYATYDQFCQRNVFDIFISNFQSPHFMHPTLYQKIVGLIYSLTFFSGKITGQFRDMADWIAYYFAHPLLFLSISRLVSVAAATGAIYCTYILGKRLHSKSTGLIAAFALAICSSFIRVSVRTQINSMAVFMTVAAFCMILNARKQPSQKNTFFAGLICGLALSTDYPLALLALPLSVSIMWPDNPSTPLKSRFYLLTVAVAAAVLAFLISSPFMALNLKMALRDFVHQASLYKAGFYTTTYLMNDYFIYIKWLANDKGFGLPFALLAFGGIFLFALSRSREKIIFLLFPVVMLCFFSFARHKEFRFVFPALPFLAVCGGYTSVLIWRTVNEKISLRKLKPILAVLVFLYASSNIIEAFSKPDMSRPAIQMRQWFLENAPDNSIIIFEQGFPEDLPKNPAQLKVFEESIWAEKRHKLLRQAAERYIENENLSKSFFLYKIPDFNSECGLLYSPGLFRLIGANYFVVSNILADALIENPLHFQQVTAFYNWLESSAEQKILFSNNKPDDGFSFQVYQLPQYPPPTFDDAQQYIESLKNSACALHPDFQWIYLAMSGSQQIQNSPFASSLYESINFLGAFEK